MPRLVPALAVAALLSVTVAAQTAVPVVDRAIAGAIAERMGAGAEIKVLRVTPAFGGEFLSIAIDPTARLGSALPMSIVLGPAQNARVIADVIVVTDYVTAVRPLVAGQVIAAGDVAPARGVVKDVPLRRLPTIGQRVGGRTLRPIAVGDLIQIGFVSPVAAVKAGQAVTAIARIGSVEATAKLVAVDNGAIDDVIRILNPDTRRTLRAKVVSPGVVEVLNVQ